MALALLTALALTGCSAIKLGYEQAPTLLYWWLDGHLDFNEVQSPRVRETLDRLQQWHRKQELPATADVLSRMALLAQAPVEVAQTCQLGQEIEQRVNLLMRETIRQLAPALVQLEARQIKHLGKHLDEKNAKWDEQWLQGSAAARLQRRLDKAADRFSDFYGSLSSPQMALLRKQLEQSAWTPEWGRQERLRQQGDLLAVLARIERDKPPARQIEAALIGVWERWLQPASETDRLRWQAWTQQGCNNLAEFQNTTSPEQRQRAARRLRAYEKDLRELVGRS